MGLGLKPSPPGQRVLYSAADKTQELARTSISDRDGKSFDILRLGLLALQELLGGHSSHGFPQAPPREQQQEARVTPTPISRLQEIPPSPRALVSRKQLPTRVSEDAHVQGGVVTVAQSNSEIQLSHFGPFIKTVSMFENQNRFFLCIYIFFI